MELISTTFESVSCNVNYFIILSIFSNISAELQLHKSFKIFLSSSFQILFYFSRKLKKKTKNNKVFQLKGSFSPSVQFSINFVELETEICLPLRTLFLCFKERCLNSLSKKQCSKITYCFNQTRSFQIDFCLQSFFFKLFSYNY